MALVLQVGDVKRALVRGAVVGLVNSLALVIACEVEWPLTGSRTSFCLCDSWAGATLGLPTSQAALYGALVGLLAVPLTLAEILWSRRTRSARDDFAFAVGTWAIMALLIGLALIQGLYTYEMHQGSFTRATAQIHNKLAANDPYLYVLACIGGAVPVAVTTGLRVRGESLWWQMVYTPAFSSPFVLPLLVIIDGAPLSGVPTFAIAAWIFGAAASLGPLSSLADRLVGAKEPCSTPAT